MYLSRQTVNHRKIQESCQKIENRVTANDALTGADRPIVGSQTDDEGTDTDKVVVLHDEPPPPNTHTHPHIHTSPSSAGYDA